MGVWDDAEADGCMTAAAILEVCKKKHADGLYRSACVMRTSDQIDS